MYPIPYCKAKTLTGPPLPPPRIVQLASMAANELTRLISQLPAPSASQPPWVKDMRYYLRISSQDHNHLPRLSFPTYCEVASGQKYDAAAVCLGCGSNY